MINLARIVVLVALSVVVTAVFDYFFRPSTPSWIVSCFISFITSWQLQIAALAAADLSPKKYRYLLGMPIRLGGVLIFFLFLAVIIAVPVSTLSVETTANLACLGFAIGTGCLSGLVAWFWVGTRILRGRQMRVFRSD